jgi:hypothetical protein
MAQCNKVGLRQFGVEVAAARKYLAALGGQDFHWPQGSRFLLVFYARDILIPCVFNGLEECWDVGGERMSVALWHTQRLAYLTIGYRYSLSTTPLTVMLIPPCGRSISPW